MCVCVRVYNDSASPDVTSAIRHQGVSSTKATLPLGPTQHTHTPSKCFHRCVLRVKATTSP